MSISANFTASLRSRYTKQEDGMLAIGAFSLGLAWVVVTLRHESNLCLSMARSFPTIGKLQNQP